MKILLGQWHAVGYAGTQLWNYTLARQFKKMGHEVAIYTGGRGMMAARCIGEGIHVYSHQMADNPKADLAIISQPRTFHVCRVCGFNGPADGDDFIVSKHIHPLKGKPCCGSNTPGKSMLPDCKRMYVMHGWLPHDAPIEDGTPYVTISDETHDRLLKSKGIESLKVNQPIDLARFFPSKPLRDKPVAASMATFAADPRVIERSCEQAGIEFQARVGQTWDTPSMLNEVDILIGTGRGCMEAMACGRAAVVCGKHGCDGLVTQDSWEELFKVNLSGRATMGDPAEDLVPALKAYNPELGKWGREIAYQLFDPRLTAEKLLEAA